MTRGIQKQDPYIGAGISLAVVLFLLYVYPGFWVPVTSRFDGSCSTIPLAASAEDLTIDPANGLVYLTYYHAPERRRGRPIPGSVMLVDLNVAEPRVRAALTTEPANFAPSGVSLFTPPSGPKRMFAVSRQQPGKHTIEVFDQSSTGAFTPVETITDQLLWSPVAIVAVGPRQFYVVNDSGLREKDASDRRKFWTGKLRNNRATALYFDGATMKVVAGNLSMASGIAVSPDGRTVYIAESSGSRLALFDRDVTSGELKLRTRVDLDTSPHNLTVDVEGNVWVAGRPQGAFLRNLGDEDARLPTQVLKLTPGSAPGKEISEIYVNDGTELSSGSVAAARGNQLVIGSFADRKLLLCTRGAAPVAAPKPVISGPEKDT